MTFCVDQRRVIPLAQDRSSVLRDILVRAAFPSLADEEIIPNVIDMLTNMGRDDERCVTTECLLFGVSENSLPHRDSIS